MTLAEQLRTEGEIKGEIKGTLKVAERLLAENLELTFVQKVTGLSLAQLRELQKKH